jgi:hypothetical protein
MIGIHDGLHVCYFLRRFLIAGLIFPARLCGHIYRNIPVLIDKREFKLPERIHNQKPRKNRQENNAQYIKKNYFYRRFFDFCFA